MIPASSDSGARWIYSEAMGDKKEDADLCFLMNWTYSCNLT